VKDTSAPSFVNFPADATVECARDSTPATSASRTGSDTCSSGTVTHSDSETSGACVNHVVKVITRTWTVTDACGNSASQAQTITLKDTTPPSFVNFPNDATVECPGDTSPTATGAPTGTDTCSSATVTHSDSETSGACVNHVVKVITRTWTVTDACGNSASQAQTITLKDTSAPTIVNLPVDATVECPGDTSPAATGAPTGSDTCSSASVTHSDSETSGACSNHVVKVITRTWTVTDACGNSASQAQTITLKDTIPPTIGQPGANATIQCPNTPVFTPPTASDTCSAATVNLVKDVTTPGSCAGTYAETRTWQAVDACGNTSGTVSQTITVQDTTPPTIGQPGANITIQCPNSPVFTPPTASDTCGTATVNLVSDVTTPGSCAATFTETRTWQAVDCAGNRSGTVTQTITVQDSHAPTIICPPDVALSCVSCVTDPSNTGMARTT